MSTAIFGGTFDPVHRGHIAMAQNILEEFSVEKLVIVPNGNPPHKKDNTISDFRHRYNMLALAFGDICEIEISDYEEDSREYRYSVDTMRYFRRLYGENTFFVIGQDSLSSINTWHLYEELLSENRFILFPRDNPLETEQLVDEYKPLAKEILVSSMPMCRISSTDIRRQISSGCDVQKFITPEIYKYIVEHGLYGGRYDS